MGVLDMIRGRNDNSIAQPGEQTDVKHESDANAYQSGSDSDNLSLEAIDEKEIQAHPNEITRNAQIGVQKAEATALVWSKPAVFATYAWIWVCFFMLALQSAIGNNVISYAYADFDTAPQITTAYILASIIGGVIKLPIAKTLNVWGRAEGFLLFVGVYLLGIILIASCTGPNGYAAGYVLYWVGFDAIYLILDVFVADTSGLRNRAFAFAFVSTPFICTAFTGPLAAQSFVTMSTWRWAYGAFAIIMPFVFIPLAIVFKFYQRKAEKMGLFVRENSGRSPMQSLLHYIHEFDIIGCLILMAAFILFLLPFTLNTYGKSQYKSASFIAMVVIGILLFPVFFVWEKYFARVHFIRWQLFQDRTVLGACCLAGILYFSFYAWDNAYYSFVIVVYDLSYAEAGYMSQIYNVGSCFWGVVFGVWVRYTKHFKYTCLFFGLPLMALGSGLMIHFRSNSYGIGFLVMCQIFIAISGGTLVIGEDMAVMAAADRDGVPMMLSIIGLSASVGGAIGYAVAAAISANTFPQALLEMLPETSPADLAAIYTGGYLVQTTYPVGSPTRDAINYAWGNTQKYECISALLVLILAVPAIAVWKNYNVDRKQNKGAVI